ncbi:MAG: O-antigen ligase family protein [Candidatus Levyibacteriota bacterium]
MRLLKILLIIMLLFLPFGEILRFGLGNDVYFKPLDATAILLAVWVAILYMRNKSWRASLKWYYFFFPVVGLLSLVINTFWLQPKETLVAFLYLIRWIGYMSIFFGLIQLDDKFKSKIQQLMIVDGIVVLLIGYLQFFLYPSLRNLFYQGWDEHLYRLFSSFLDPNFAGTFLVLYFIFLLGLLFQNIQNRHSGKSNLQYRDPGQARMTLIRVCHFSLIAITLIAIFLTYSRSAFLMLVVSGITFFSLLQKRRFIFILIGLLALFVLIISPYFYIENLNLFRVRSSMARLATDQHALLVIRDHPVVGVGFDAYRYAQEKYHFQKEPSKFPDHADAGVDMSLLFVIATTGIVGLAAYCYLWFTLLKASRQKQMGKQNMQGIVVFSSSIGLFVNALFINSLFFPAIMMWMWLEFSFLKKGEED